MEEHEQKPQWYDLARKGPFPRTKFSEANADNIVRQLQEGLTARSREMTAVRRRRAFRARMLSAAVVLLLLGAGVLYLGSDFSGRNRGFNPSVAASAVMYDSPEEGAADLTDAGFKQTAERLMQEQLGKKYPYISLKRLENPIEGVEEAEVLFQEGDHSARVWFNTETGEVIRTVMDAFYSVKEIDPAFIEEATKNLQGAGYKGKFTVTGLRHSAHYGTNDEPGIQTNDGLMGEEATIDYVNGLYKLSTYKMSENEAGAEVREAGLKAIKLLRDQGTDHLYSIERTVAPEWDMLVLTYGEDEYAAASVMMDYATQEILQVSDLALYIEKSYDSKIRGEQDANLLNMDESKLQISAAALADKLFGIRLKDYRVVDQTAPGLLTFKSPDGDLVVNASFNLKGEIYSIEQTPVP
ncbi:hypothetical protein C2I18_06475 [Paenibacillus sp. PK3_47]|uniref:hypothetical protein n=1 Tax=Paenibacillus sp. PK3_47 TaxID=2072642 RepID=UPI00201DD9F7|nr:hypothetical protein [Paenibacillus sp. PK3_47]UQZ33233.1 hypothetical protein C2I18_06475 [Paenibacillus sp. PK3_47]